jgi:hypothetical protein
MRLGTVVRVVAFAAIGTYLVASVWRNDGAWPDWQTVGQAVTAVAALAALYDRVLWRWLPPHGGPPVLHGTWKLMLRPDRGPGGTELPAPELPCYACIRQTASRMHAKVFFADGRSRITTATISRLPDGTCQLSIIYDFNPDTPSPERPRRSGAAVLDISIKRGKPRRSRYYRITLEGKFWSDELTRGAILTQGRTRRLYDTFSDASHGDYRPTLTSQRFAPPQRSIPNQLRPS